MSDKPRFLITTADERSWRTDRPVLFLGEWCRVYERRGAWEKLDAEIVPEYGWGEGQQDADYVYVRDLYEQLLTELAVALNQYHGTNHSLRYWRILVGPWLYTFTSIVFNRWETIQAAIRQFRISGTVILDMPAETTIPNSFRDFPEKYLSHAWNHALFGRILNDWTETSCERWPLKEPVKGTPASSLIPKPSLRRRSRRLGFLAVSALLRTLSRPTDAFIISSHLPLAQDFRLQLALGQLPKLWQRPTAPQVAPDCRARRRLRLNADDYRDFEHCVRTLIPEQIPSLYLEGYCALRESAAKQPWPKRPKVIFTSNNFAADDVFKAWTAEKTESGIPYVIGQHGGYYGTGKYPSHFETNEVATADRYLTWGWADNNPKHYPGAALRIVGMPTGTWDPAGGLLQVITHEMRYTRDPWGVESMQSDYREDQFRFASALPQHIRGALTVRLHAAAASHGQPHDVLWQSRYPDVRLDPGTGPIESLIRQCRLYVYTYNSTGFLETLGRDIPTIVFWNPRHWELRPSAKPYFDRLQQVGIFHESPESAAAKVAEVWSDVAGWWNRSDVQETRRYFCDRFSRMPENPIQVLKDALVTVRIGQQA